MPAMSTTANARRLRREQTDEERSLWRALRAGRFAGFKFRRQHPLGVYHLDFYCPLAKLSVELDGFHHGMPEQRLHDEERAMFLASCGVEELRFWNLQWRENREGVLLEIWNALHRRTGCVAVLRKVENHRFIPPKPDQLIQRASSPHEERMGRGGNFGDCFQQFLGEDAVRFQFFKLHARRPSFPLGCWPTV
jgi:ATP-dependent helicase HrpA/adenine-specific DNA-methyltransferase